MDHPCQHCGTAVEDGRPFCPQCRAPQIHVQVAIADVAPPANEFSSETSPVRHSDRPIMVAGSMDSRVAVRAALKAGLLGVVIAMIPVLGIVLTGVLAVFFYRRKHRIDLPAAAGARVGGAAGIIVFTVNALFVALIILSHAEQECIDRFVEFARKYGVDTSAPQFQENIHQLFTASGLVAFFITAVVLATIGGILGSLFMRSRNPRD